MNIYIMRGIRTRISHSNSKSTSLTNIQRPITRLTNSHIGVVNVEWIIIACGVVRVLVVCFCCVVEDV